VAALLPVFPEIDGLELVAPEADGRRKICTSDAAARGAASDGAFSGQVFAGAPCCGPDGICLVAHVSDVQAQPPFDAAHLNRL